MLFCRLGGLLFFFFFFQAEDGIRDGRVTGVQTCALPISTELVPTVTLDWLAARFPAPDVIKIDVEEAEMTVLTGGSRVLDRSPAIICEVAASNATPVWDLLNARGYAVYDGDRPRRERVPVAAAPPNTLAISS